VSSGFYCLAMKSRMLFERSRFECLSNQQNEFISSSLFAFFVYFFLLISRSKPYDFDTHHPNRNCFDLFQGTVIAGSRVVLE
jgi:hypothetical protein